MKRSVLLAILIAPGCAEEHPQPRAPYLPEVYIEYRADKADAILERRYGDWPWIPVCTPPCSRTVRPDFEYRVGGESIVPSKPFRIYEPTTIVVRAGDRSMKALGAIGLSVGLPLVLIGSFMFGTSLRRHSDGVDWVGGGLLGLGLGCTVGGALAATQGNTVVQFYDRTPVAFRF